MKTIVRQPGLDSARVEAYCRKHPNATGEEVRAATGASQRTVWHVLRRLRAAGLVVRRKAVGT